MASLNNKGGHSAAFLFSAFFQMITLHIALTHRE